MTRRRRPPAAELLGDELAGMRADIDELRAEMRFLRNLWALAPFARPGSRPRVFIPAQRLPICP